MFYNISNHPIYSEKTTWSAEQQAEAKRLGGTLIDVPFPTVTPDMSDEQLRSIAHEVARDLAGQTPYGDQRVAMVAGEYATTILLIGELQAMGFTCLFGQSERIAEERIEDGKVVVVHKFVFRGFREAPAIQLV